MEDWKSLQLENDSEQSEDQLSIQGAGTPPPTPHEPDPKPTKKPRKTKQVTHAAFPEDDLVSTILGPQDQQDQEDAKGEVRTSYDVGTTAAEALARGSATAEAEAFARGSTATRASKSVSIQLRNIDKEFVEDDIGGDRLAEDAEGGISGGGRGGGPGEEGGGPPHLSILEIPEEGWHEQDVGLRQATVTMAHTLIEKECAAVDVIRVWEEISKFILLKMMEGRAVIIAGLGTFTYKVHKTPVNQKTLKVMKCPVFILSEHLISTYGLMQDKHHHSNAPQVPLNLSVIAYETRLPRGMIDGILTEILQAFARGVVCNKALELPFPGIGKLHIRAQKASFKFYAMFCNQLGFNTSETRSQERVAEYNLIPGRMTPLKHHIPSDPYRSVLHLREVRSVHDDSVTLPLTQVEGKYVPVTIAGACGVQKNSDDAFPSEYDLETFAPTLNELKLKAAETEKLQLEGRISDAKFGKNFLEVERERIELRRTQMERSMNGCFNPKPLYQPQPTGDCVLDAMNKCPEVMSECLRAHLYRVFIETLGREQVKSHFHRRGHHGVSPQVQRAQVMFNKISPSDSTDSDNKEGSDHATTASDYEQTERLSMNNN